jgi:hypothetical protein
MQSPMTRTPGAWLRTARLAAIATFALLATGCSDGQLVDAGGERGSGGLAFVLMTIFFWIFFASLFYMDRQRKKRNAPEE